MAESRESVAETTPAQTSTVGAENASTTAGAVPAPTATIGGTLRRLGPLAPLAVIACTLPALGGFATLYYINPLADWFRSHGDVGPLVYVAGFIICGGLALLPTYAQAALGGWAFGFAVGAAAALGGFTGAAILGYVIARYLSGDRALRIIDEHPKWKAVYEALLGSGFWRSLGIVTLLRLPPNSPFAATNLVLAATRVSPLAYGIGTLIGLAPRTLAMIYIAASLKEFDLAALRQSWLFWSGVVVTVVVLAIIGHLANQAISNVTGARQANGGASASQRSPKA